MSSKSRRARARLVQEQALVAKLKQRRFDLAAQCRRHIDDIASLSKTISDLRCEIDCLRETVVKQRRKDVIVARKSEVDYGFGPQYAIQMTIDARHVQMAFQTPSRRQSAEFDVSEMRCVDAFSANIARELCRKLERGIADILNGKATTEELV